LSDIQLIAKAVAATHRRFEKRHHTGSGQITRLGLQQLADVPGALVAIGRPFSFRRSILSTAALVSAAILP
jgi:hypothetical protein